MTTWMRLGWLLLGYALLRALCHGNNVNAPSSGGTSLTYTFGPAEYAATQQPSATALDPVLQRTRLIAGFSTVTQNLLETKQATLQLQRKVQESLQSSSPSQRAHITATLLANIDQTLANIEREMQSANGRLENLWKEHASEMNAARVPHGSRRQSVRLNAKGHPVEAGRFRTLLVEESG